MYNPLVEQMDKDWLLNKDLHVPSRELADAAEVIVKSRGFYSLWETIIFRARGSRKSKDFPDRRAVSRLPDRFNDALPSQILNTPLYVYMKVCVCPTMVGNCQSGCGAQSCMCFAMNTLRKRRRH